MKVEIKKTEVPYEHRFPDGRVFFRVEKATLSHERFDGSMSPDISRTNFNRGDGVGVILYSEEDEEVVLVEQFRYPVYAGYPENKRDGKGWILEIVSGIKDADGQAVARRELFEETGYSLKGPLEHLSTFYVSPGGTSERIEMYLARVKKAEGILKEAGIPSEAEDIRTHVVPFERALKMIDEGEIVDGKTIIALLMLKDRVGKKD